MAKIEVISGAEVNINPASFEAANNLKNEIFRAESENKGFSVSLPDTDRGVLAALWHCLARCTYNNNKITPEIFEATAAREDYYPILSACVKENLTPFLRGLASVSPLAQALSLTNFQQPK
jgi:hypothetical protein